MTRVIIAMTAAVLLLGACAPQGSKESPDIAAFSDRWATALNSGDVDAIMALYVDDLRVLPPHEEMKTGKHAREAFDGMVAAGITAELGNVEARESGDIGYHVGTYELRAKDGSLVDRGKYVETLRKVGGEWKITNDTWNSDLPVEAGPVMVAVHDVEDRAHWIAAWQDARDRRALFAKHGAPKVRIFQGVDQPNSVGLIIEVTDAQAFEAFLGSPEGAAAKQADGVKDKTIRRFTEVK